MLSQPLKARMLAAKDAIECNATDGRTIDDALSEWANAPCQMDDAEGDIWDSRQTWWDDSEAIDFLAYCHSE